MYGGQKHALEAGQVGVGAQEVALLAACTSLAIAPPRARRHCTNQLLDQLQWRALPHTSCVLGLISRAAFTDMLSYQQAIKHSHSQIMLCADDR